MVCNVATSLCAQPPHWDPIRYQGKHEFRTKLKHVCSADASSADLSSADGRKRVLGKLNQSRIDHLTCECPVCHRKTSGLALVCRFSHHLLFERRWYITIALIFSPTLLCIALAQWQSSIVVYSALSVGLTVYVVAALRRMNPVLLRTLLWLAPALAVQELLALAPDKEMAIWNIAALAYAFTLLMLFGIHIRYSLELSSTAASIFSVALMQSVLIYSLVFNVVSWFHGRGLGPDFYYPYQQWIPYITQVRYVLLSAIGIFCAVIASHKAHGRGVPEHTYGSMFLYIIGARTRWFVTEFLHTIWEAFQVTLRVSVKFWFDTLIPWLLAISCSMHLMLFARYMVAYLTGGGGTGFLLLLEAATIGAHIYCLEFISLISFCTSDIEWFPPVSAMFPEFRRGAAADLDLLIFNLSWLVPFTVLVLKGLAHTPLEAISPAFGWYSWAGLALGGVTSALAYYRSAHAPLSASQQYAVQSPEARLNVKGPSDSSTGKTRGSVFDAADAVGVRSTGAPPKQEEGHPSAPTAPRTHTPAATASSESAKPANAPAQVDTKPTRTDDFRTLVILVVLLCVAVSVAWWFVQRHRQGTLQRSSVPGQVKPVSHSDPIADGSSFSLEASYYNPKQFTVPSGALGPKVVGHFSITGGEEPAFASIFSTKPTICCTPGVAARNMYTIAKTAALPVILALPCQSRQRRTILFWKTPPHLRPKCRQPRPWSTVSNLTIGLPVSYRTSG